MIKHSNAEIKKFLSSIYPTTYTYGSELSTIEILSNTRDKVTFKVERMYDYVPLNLEILLKLAGFFDTKKIDTDKYSYAGCATCDFGSSYEIEFTVRPEE